MHYIHLVAALAVLQFFFFGIMVGGARARFEVKAPATTGNEHFERAFRVQMNTLEQLTGFLPALYIAGQFWPPTYVAAVGIVYLVGRFVYRRSYMPTRPREAWGFCSRSRLHSYSLPLALLAQCFASRPVRPNPSSGATTTEHQARSGGTRYLFFSPGLASCRCRPLSSNARRLRLQLHSPAVWYEHRAI